MFSGQHALAKQSYWLFWERTFVAGNILQYILAPSLNVFVEVGVMLPSLALAGPLFGPANFFPGSFEVWA